MNKFLKVSDFEVALGEKLNEHISSQIDNFAFEYQEFSPQDIDFLLKKIVETLLDTNLMRSGEHRLDQWEAGWSENLDNFLRDPQNIDLIMPKYFNKYGAVRWCGRFIKPISEKFEANSLAIILDWLFDKYMRNISSIYEFGCGTGHNLLRARIVNPVANLIGLDWATSSQKLIKKMREVGVDQRLSAHQFDYFNPDYSIQLEKDSAIYTVASLEQVGSRWRPFIEYIVKSKPSICVHVEPIAELLDEEKFIDYLSIEYFKKRNYLEGFYTGLKQMECEGKIIIHEAKRTNIGSLFIEGYSVIVWSPI